MVVQRGSIFQDLYTIATANVGRRHAEQYHVYLGLGYFQGQKVYLGWSINHQKIFASDSATFQEDFFICRPPESRHVNDLQFYQAETNLPETFPIFENLEIPELLETPLSALDWGPMDNLWNFEADEVITPDLHFRLLRYTRS